MKRVYVHNNSPDQIRSTVAVDMPDDFLDKVKRDIGAIPHGSIVINVGSSFVHPEDAYVKSTGRGIASSRMNYVWFYLQNIHFLDDRTIIRLTGEDNNIVYSMCVHVYRDSGNVRVMECAPDVNFFD